MPDTSTRFLISEPSADRHDAADVPLYIRNVVAALEAKGTIYGQGLLAARPVSTGGSPGIQGRLYYATDTAALYYDFGTGWTQIGSIAFSGYGTLASRPAASGEPDGWMYWATDTKVLYQNEAGTWTQVSATAQYTTSVGDGVSTSYVINHNLGSQNVVVQVRQAASPFAVVHPDIQATDANNVTLVFDTAPSSGQYSVTILGGSTGSPSSPSAHASTHAAGGSDALAWGTIMARGTLAARPAAAAGNSSYRYFATDVNGGTEYQSDGATWNKVGLGLTEGIYKFFDSVLGSPAASFDITSIPAGKVLKIFGQFRGTSAVTTTSLIMRFNNDSGANYDYESYLMRGTPNNAAGNAATGVSWQGLNSANDTALAFTSVEITIPNYAGVTARKEAHGILWGKDAADGTATSYETAVGGGEWRTSATAITRVTLILNAGNFDTGSWCAAEIHT